LAAFELLVNKNTFIQKLLLRIELWSAHLTSILPASIPWTFVLNGMQLQLSDKIRSVILYCQKSSWKRFQGVQITNKLYTHFYIKFKESLDIKILIWINAFSTFECKLESRNVAWVLIFTKVSLPLLEEFVTLINVAFFDCNRMSLYPNK